MSSIHLTKPLPSFTPKNPLKVGYKCVKNGLGFIAKEIGDGGTANAVAKFARRFFEFLAIFETLAPFVSIPATFFKSFSELFKVMGIFKGAHDVLTAKKVVNLARSILGVTICTLSIAKLIDTFRWISLGKITAAFGKIPVIGAASIVPVGVVIGWLEALKAALDISIALKNLVNLSKKVNKINQKKNFWTEGLTEDKCKKRVYSYEATEKVLEKEVQQLEAEKEAAHKKAHKWNNIREAALQTRKDKLEQQNKVRRCFTKSSNLLRHVVQRKEDRKLKKWLKIDKQLAASLKTKTDSLNKVSQKKVVWACIGNTLNKTDPLNKIGTVVTDALKKDLEAIETMRNSKLEKWKFRKSNVRFQQFKESMSVFLNGAVIVMVTGSTVLFFIGLFGSPVGGAVMPILLPTLGLVVASVGLGMLFFKRIKGKEVKVELPQLSNEEPVKRMLQRRLNSHHKQRPTKTLTPDLDTDNFATSQHPSVTEEDAAPAA
ncbi:MAG: hypothetical protein ACSNEK_08695 [Parachlamydiaceae bacterium]